MSIFAGLSLLVFLRRIAIAEERLADVAEARLEHDRHAWDKESPRRPRPTEFGEFDVAAANELWRKEQEAREVGATLEDRTK